MRPCAGTVGRAVFGLAAVLVGRGAPACAPGGFAAHSDNGLLTMLRHPRSRAGVLFSIRPIGIQREDMQ
jgi:hypothetical protein